MREFGSLQSGETPLTPAPHGATNSSEWDLAPKPRASVERYHGMVPSPWDTRSAPSFSHDLTSVRKQKQANEINRFSLDSGCEWRCCDGAIAVEFGFVEREREADVPGSSIFSGIQRLS